MKIHLFGAATPTGEALTQLVGGNLVGYSRTPSTASNLLYLADLNNPSGFHPAGCLDCPSIWISFAPIWLLAPFLENLRLNRPACLQGLRGVIACSSSSVITKRFAANRFDRQLVPRLIDAEDLIIYTCRQLSIPCKILRPTLIYGQVGAYRDGNLSRLIQLMRRFPVLPLPADSGLRQPIHASQLAAVSLHLSKQLAAIGRDSSLPDRIELGGDTTLTYSEMLRALQLAQPSDDTARCCRFLLIPNPVFFLLAAPLLLYQPKAFEAVLRMGANLSGFTPANQLLASEATPFPILLKDKGPL